MTDEELFKKFLEFHGYVDEFCDVHDMSMLRIRALSMRLGRFEEYENKTDELYEWLYWQFINSDCSRCDFIKKHKLKSSRLSQIAERLGRKEEYSRIAKERGIRQRTKLLSDHYKKKRKDDTIYCDPIVIGNSKYEISAISQYHLSKRVEHPRSKKNNYMSIHRLIAESKIGRMLEKTEKVHHIDFDKHNNDEDNLLVLNNDSQHSLLQSYLMQILVQYVTREDLHKITYYLKDVVENMGPGRRIALRKLPYTIPLYDNHAHLGGSIEPEIVAAMLAKHGSKIRIGKVRKSMTYQGKKPDNFGAFIKKFEMLNKVQWTEEDIYDSVHQVVSKIDMDGVECSEIRFSIGKYRPYLKMNDVEIIKLIRRAFDDASEYFNVKVNLVLSFRHNATEKDLRVARQIDKYAGCIVGIDVSGDEKYMDVNKFLDIYKIWKSNGKTLMAHVGEQPETYQNVRDAIEKWGITRVAHGIYSDKYTLDMAKDMGVCFDLAISSNYYTGVVKHRHAHPAMAMLNNGNIVTLGTDDASVFCTSLRKEYALAKEYWCLSDSDINGLKLNAIKYSTFG